MILEKEGQEYLEDDQFFDEQDDELVMVIELFRHGARRELMDMKGKRTFPDKHFDQGDLTIVGMKQHYLLGKSIREKYSDFIGDKPNQKNVIVEASNSRRCLISAQSHIMGIFDLGSGCDIESKYHIPPFKGYTEKDKQKNAMPHRYSPYAIKNNSDNFLFDVWGCKITNEIVNKNFDRMDRIYSNVFQVLYKNLEKNGYNVKDIFDEDKWTVQRGNSVCDWIFTRVYYFGDFQIDQVLYEQCRLMMAFDNFSRYKDKLYFKTFASPMNEKLLKLLKHKIDNKNDPTKLHILSGHDDNVATFLLNFKYDNNDCIAKEFDQKFNDGKNQSNFQDLFCYDHLLFTTNIILELIKNKSKYYVKIWYNGTQGFLERSRYTFDEFNSILSKNTDPNFDKNCYQNYPDNSMKYLLLSISFILIVLIIYFAMKKKRYSNI